MTENIIYIADDLTGACDIASFICDYTGTAEVAIDFFEDKLERFLEKIKGVSDFNMVISTNTRDLETEIAYSKLQKLSNFLKEIQAGNVFKKIDSAFRGNVVFEINTLMDLLDIDVCFVINAIPSIGRITLGGFQLINGKILNDSEFSKDPVSIAGSSFIPHLFSETCKKEYLRKAAHISLETVRYGDILKAVETNINKKINIISFDSVVNEDIEKIINNIYEKFGKALYVGTLGLLTALNMKIFNHSGNKLSNAENKSDFKADSLNKKHRKNKFHIVKKFIGFTSSKYEITKKQIRHLNKIYGSEIIKIKINDFLNKNNSDYFLKVQDTINEIISNFANNSFFIVAEFKGRKEPDNLSKMILKIISDIANGVLKKVEIERLILVGGETSLNILKSLKAKSIEIKGRISDGISYGIIADGLLKGKEMVIKGGSVGEINSIENMVSFKF